MASSPELAPEPAAEQPSYGEVVTSDEVITSVYVSLIGGLAFLALWAFFRSPLRAIYEKRTQLSDLPARPPPLRMQGILHRCLGYLAPVFLLNDYEFVQTAGLDALILCRFLVLGFQIFLPVAAVCCAVIIPLTMTGTYAETSYATNLAEIMRYTLSNIQPGSPKFWAPFALSYFVLGYTMYCLVQHYKSYAMLRLLHLRHSALNVAGGAPHMTIVGFEPRGWPAVRQTLLQLCSPLYMLRRDTEYVKRYLEKCAAAEAAASASATQHSSVAVKTPSLAQPVPTVKGSTAEAGTGTHEEALVQFPVNGDETAGKDDTANTQSDKGCASAASDGDCDGSAEEDEYAKAAVLPWWLPPEKISACYTAEKGTSGVLHGKTCPPNRKRVLAVTHAGQRVWVSAEQYAVLFTVAGPPPSSELWRLLRPAPPVGPDTVLVSPAKDADMQEAETLLDDSRQEDNNNLNLNSDTDKNSREPGIKFKEAPSDASGSVAGLGASPDAQQPGEGAELLAGKLTDALQELFPGTFSHLARVYNHREVDELLVKHEEAATRRDRCATLVAKARKKLLGVTQATAAAKGECVAANAEASAPSGAEISKAAVNGEGLSSAGATVVGGAQGKLGLGGGAGARLARAEAELARLQVHVEKLEEQIHLARQAALQSPVGTAFIGLFSDQTSAALAANVRASIVSSVNFNVRACPGPDNINWSALWSTWGQRMVRGAAVIPFLALMMIFPIGVLTGALTNLDTAVCGGTPETNSLYWPWYCEQTSGGAKLLQGLLQGILPSIISMTWDTYVLPMAFFFSSQCERRHQALSDLDERITILFFNFNVFNTFLGSVLGGAFFQQAGSLVNQPGYWLQLLGAALPTASTYFLNYIIIHALCTNFFRLIWPHEGTVLFVIFRWIGLFRPACERDHAMIRTPPSFRGARHFGSFLLIQIMALSYAVIAPLVLPAALGFFLTAWVTWRYCCIYFYERSYESGGRIFETLFSLMVWTMALFTTFTSLVLASKKAYTASLVALFTQLPALLIYHRRVSLEVGHYAHLLPLQATLTAPRATVDPAMFLPPPLRQQAVGWHPEWGKVWEKYGVTRYSW